MKTAKYYANNPEARSNKKEYDTEFNATEKQKKRRALRNKLRRKFAKKGKVKKGDGKDVHHTGGNSVGKAVVMSASKNRALK
tara:strand:- start:1209 stop:1454 length:246 start_codon:yes stop_codon:yes gene_type:complete